MVQESGLVCSVCGTVNDKKAKFCNECGNKLKQEKACLVCEKNTKEQDITDNTLGSELMADDFDFRHEFGENQKAFGGFVNREEINIIIFSDKMNEVPDDAWDVSSKHDGSVMAYIRNTSDLTELIIVGEKGVRANPNCSCLFGGYKKLLQINFNGCFDTSRVESMYRMFSKCEQLEKLDVSEFDTRKVKNMQRMFFRCENLKTINVSGFDTSQVTKMESMFSCCKRLKQLDISRFDTSQVTDMEGMFSGCEQIEQLDISVFDTSQVTDMAFMFSGCKRLKQLDISRFDTSQVTDMENMFEDCRQLRQLDISGFDTSQVTNMNFMFKDCKQLKQLDISGFNISRITSLGDMWGTFAGCEQLKQLDISGFDINQITDKKYMFDGCSNMEVCVWIPLAWLQRLF